MVRIGAFRKTSLVDWQGKIVSTIFTIGCNFRCFWCHNQDLVFGRVREIPEEIILKKLKKNKWIDGVCITGGEPTIQKDLETFLSRISELGLPVKLDTNGTHPEILQSLIRKKLVQFIAMDIKAPPEKYPLLTGTKSPPLNKIKKSISLIMNSGIDYEFRTTMVPGYLSPIDIENIAKMIPNAQKYAIQAYIPVPSYPLQQTMEELKRAAAVARKYVKRVVILNILGHSPKKLSRL